jgi:hypothetical protein
LTRPPPYEFHRERFAWIVEELKGTTQRVMVSIVDFYRKTERRLSQLEREEGYSFDRDVLSSNGITKLLKDLANIATKNNIEIFTCAEEKDYSQTGVLPGRCIDERLLTRIWSLNLKYKKDPYQRKPCLCMVSKDIGINNTCIHGFHIVIQLQTTPLRSADSMNTTPFHPYCGASQRSRRKPLRKLVLR